MGSATNDRASARAPRQRELRRPEPRGLPLPGVVTSRARSARDCLLDERGEQRDLRGRGQALVILGERSGDVLYDAWPRIDLARSANMEQSNTEAAESIKLY